MPISTYDPQLARTCGVTNTDQIPIIPRSNEDWEEFTQHIFLISHVYSSWSAGTILFDMKTDAFSYVNIFKTGKSVPILLYFRRILFTYLFILFIAFGSYNNEVYQLF